MAREPEPIQRSPEDKPPPPQDISAAREPQPIQKDNEPDPPPR